MANGKLDLSQLSVETFSVQGHAEREQLKREFLDTELCSGTTEPCTTYCIRETFRTQHKVCCG
ncbi:MAG TPA: hypothetical protein VHG08_19205 [Longimicrobium sp.]|nr:hypothetical protein [Longimicrobium sp.]